MRRLLTAALLVALVAPTMSAVAAPLRGGSLSGITVGSGAQVAPKTVMQLRNLATGRIADKMTSGPNGTFSFAGLDAGTYIVEMINDAGQIVGTSGAVTIAGTVPVTGVTVVHRPSFLGVGFLGGLMGSGGVFGPFAAVGIVAGATIGTIVAVRPFVEDASGTN